MSPRYNNTSVLTTAETGALMRRVAAGDAAAYEQIVRALGPFVIGRAQRIVGSRDGAEDVAQTVFTTIWTKASAFSEGRGNLHAWLQTLTRNAAIDYLRVEGRHSRNSRAMRDTGRIETTNLASGLELRDEQRRIRDAMAALGKDQREAIELAYFGDLTYVEVAERLGEPEGTVKSRIRRGMKQLARLVGEERE